MAVRMKSVRFAKKPSLTSRSIWPRSTSPTLMVIFSLFSTSAAFFGLAIRRSLRHLRTSLSPSTWMVSSSSACRRTAELPQLRLDQRGEPMDLRQRVGIGVAAEEELLAVTDHSDRERMARGNGDDGVDLFE